MSKPTIQSQINDLNKKVENLERLFALNGATIVVSNGTAQPANYGPLPEITPAIATTANIAFNICPHCNQTF